MSLANLKQVFTFLSDRLGNKPIKLKVKAPNGRRWKPAVEKSLTTPTQQPRSSSNVEPPPSPCCPRTHWNENRSDCGGAGNCDLLTHSGDGVEAGQAGIPCWAVVKPGMEATAQMIHNTSLTQIKFYDCGDRKGDFCHFCGGEISQFAHESLNIHAA